MKINEDKFTHFILANTTIFREAQKLPKKEEKREEKNPLVQKVERILFNYRNRVDDSLLNFYRDLYSAFLSTELEIKPEEEAKGINSIIPLVAIRRNGELHFTTYMDRSDDTVRCYRVNGDGGWDVNWVKYSASNFFIASEEETMELIRRFKESKVFSKPIPGVLKDSLEKCGYLDIIVDR